MKLEITISGREEARIAAEFMARITALRYPTVSDAEIKMAVEEEQAGATAEVVIEKAAKAPAKPKKQAVEPEVESVETIKVDRAALQRLAAAKASGGKASQVKEIIATFGTKIIDVPEDKLADLLAQLEAL